MLSSELLDLLCCPETRQPLRAATAEELAVVNREGMLNRAGRIVGQPVATGLVREDRAVLYPIWDGIPCLLIEEGFALNSSFAAS